MTSIPIVVFPDLPQGAHYDNRWDGVFIPTMLRYMGFQTNFSALAWEHEFSIPFLRQIWTAVYGNSLSWTVQPQDLVYVKVSIDTLVAPSRSRGA